MEQRIRGGQGSFPSQRGREKSDNGWRNSPVPDTNFGFGFEPDPFETAFKKYGIWPVTVWDCDYTDKMMQQLKKEVGDGCQVRAGSGSLGYQSKTYEGHGKDSRKGSALGGHTYKQAFKQTEIRQKHSAKAECFTKANELSERVYAGKITESIFNPTVVIWILNLFAPSNAIVYDPFAGGGTRAIVTEKSGRKYIGVELRQEEVDAIYDRCDYNKVHPEIICADSRNVPQIKSQSAEFLITCPPYWNLEKYDGGANDMSMAKSYDDFLDMVEGSIQESHRILKSGSLVCWVVGLHRNSEGELLAMNHDIAALHQNNGFRFKEEIVLHLQNTGAIQRVGNFERGNHFLVRTHEYCVVFERK